jgi:hypothetical protein
VSLRARAFVLLLTVAGIGGCFQAWPFVGPYTCNMGSCPSGLVCDDGLCCKPGGEPACRTRVLDGGSCAGGGVPKMYYEDLDDDGYGNPKAGRLLCSKPVVEPFVDNTLDCDDSSAEANPKGAEKCDGLDNNCDTQIDEGLMPVKTYFRDEDGDGYGDPAMTLTACAAPKGWVESNNDCEPAVFTVHPGAPELCNNIDDNCSGMKDEAAVDVGGDCLDAGMGECSQGTIGCVGGAKVCQSLKIPKPDICDSLDNNCNGVVDEQPECGGPVSLRTGPVVGGAQDMNRSLASAELTAGCHKGIAGATGETWAPPTWSGSGGSDHILYFEPSSGVWDLTRPGLKLRLAMSWTMVSPQNPAWQNSSQPVLFVCAESGFNRYVHVSTDGGTNTLINSAGGSFDETVPLAANSNWLLGMGSGADLKRVKRIELLVRPSGISGATTPTFNFTVGASSGFVP